jgi:hypothetical protein
MRHPVTLTLALVGIVAAVVIAVVLRDWEYRLIPIVVVLAVALLPYLRARTKDRGERFF